MIITITGMPCSGKTSIVNYLKENYGFKVISVSKIFREEAERKGLDVVEMNKVLDTGGITQLDREMDELSVKLGKENDGQRVIFDSRLAWHFVPRSFKVFLKLRPEVMIERLKNSDRNEKEKNAGTTDNGLLERFEIENKRFANMYNVNIKDESNYDFVLDNSDMSIEEGAEIIYKKYLDFISK